MAISFTACGDSTGTVNKSLGIRTGIQIPAGLTTTQKSFANSRTCKIAASKLCLLLRNVLRSSDKSATALGDRNRSLSCDVQSRRSTHRLPAAKACLGSKPVACTGF